ncbi:MAG: undecaprenyl-diphosphate phosphatase [Clostridiaceae bacterium]
MWLIIKAIIIGIVEGITEFLPISSTGHMIIVGDMINFKDPADYVSMFEIVIQLGAILAIVVLYRKKIWDTLKNLFGGDKSGLKFWINIIVAVIPSAIIGILLNDLIEEKLFNTFTVAIGLLVGGILLILVENKYRRRYKTKTIDDVNVVQAFKIGCFQCLALWPGMSRSASTIMGAWICGLSTVAAAEFSFFLAIPTMVGASILSLGKHGINNLTFDQSVALIVGFVVSFLVALLVVDKFINFLKKKKMRPFSVYRIVLGIVLLLMYIF